MKALTPVPLALLLLCAGHAAAQGHPARGTPQLARQFNPPSPQPLDLPPPATEDLPPVPQEQGAVPQQQPAATGEWIFTAQYGWIWMPYGGGYISSATIAGYAPYAYVYHPLNGWLWLTAPWVYGWGVIPHFGARGPSAFAWYDPGRHGGHDSGHVRSGIRNRHFEGGHFPGAHVTADRHRGGGGHRGHR